MILRGIASHSSLDRAGTFIAEGALRWDASAAIPLLLHHQPGAKVGRVLKLWWDGKALMCVAQADESLPAVRAFLSAHKAFGFSVGAINAKGAKGNHLEIVTSADISEISLTDHPAHAACRVDETYGGGLMSGMDEHWAALAMAPKRPFFNVQHLIRYPEQEPAL